MTLELIAQINLSCDRYVRFELLFATDGVDKAERKHAQMLELCSARCKHEAVVLLRQHSRQQASRSSGSWLAAARHEHS